MEEETHSHYFEYALDQEDNREKEEELFQYLVLQAQIISVIVFVYGHA